MSIIKAASLVPYFSMLFFSGILNITKIKISQISSSCSYMSILREKFFRYVLFTNEFDPFLIPAGGNFTTQLTLMKKIISF